MENFLKFQLFCLDFNEFKYRESSAYTGFFETLEKQPCKQRSDLVLNGQNKLCYLENRVVREPV